MSNARRAKSSNCSAPILGACSSSPAELHVELAGLDIGTEVSIEIDAYNIHGDAGSFHL